MLTVNMKIIKTMIKHEDHYQGLVVSITLEGEGQGTIFICSLNKLEKVLDIIGINSYEELNGSYCRARFSEFILREIGNIINDNWLVLEEVTTNGEIK